METRAAGEIPAAGKGERYAATMVPSTDRSCNAHRFSEWVAETAGANAGAATTRRVVVPIDAISERRVAELAFVIRACNNDLLATSACGTEGRCAEIVELGADRPFGKLVEHASNARIAIAGCRKARIEILRAVGCEATDTRSEAVACRADIARVLAVSSLEQVGDYAGSLARVAGCRLTDSGRIAVAIAETATAIVLAARLAGTVRLAADRYREETCGLQ